ncbi:cytochrome P450 [Aspergillus insuetus]
MDLLPNSMSTANISIFLQDLWTIYLERPPLAIATLCALILAASYLLRTKDPYNLNAIPTVQRSRFLDAYRSGVWWRFILPRFHTYVREAYLKYSTKDKPFRIWLAPFQIWVYVLPLKYLPQIKNQGIAELSLRSFIDKATSAQLSSGSFDTFEVQVGSKLLNGNLIDIKPIVQTRTEQILERVIGRPRDWRRFNIRALSVQVVKHVSGRIAFGEALADNPGFLDAMERYSLNVIPYALALRYFNLGPLRYPLLYLIHLRQRQTLAIATRYVTDLIAERQRREKEHHLTDDEKPVDCIQWSMDQDMPDEQKAPEAVAHRLLHISAALIDAPSTSMMNVLVDIISYARDEVLNDLRAEMVECLAEFDGAWTEASMAKMKKLDSFFQESFRMTSGLIPMTGWRLIAADSFRFDDNLVFPRGSTIVFPTQCIQLDPNIYPDPDKFDYLRFHRMKEHTQSTDARTGRTIPHHDWLSFGHGRQACPGRFYSIRLLKTILGEMMLRYDIRYAGGDRPRPPSIDVEPILAPDTTVELEFRVRPDVT